MPAFATPEPITATLFTGGARVTIAASERTDTTVLVEPVDSADTSHVKVAEKTTVDFTGGELTVKTVKSGEKDGSVAITIELPTGSGLVLNTAWSDVQADGRFGDCALDMASGRVRLDHVAALRGNLAAGEVEVGHVAGAVHVDGGTADVRLGTVEGSVRYEGSTGQVRIGHAASDVELGGSSGRFDIDRADGDVVAKAAACPIRIGVMGGGRAELTNASGGIEVGIAEGTAAVVDADSTKGAVRNSLPAQDDLASFANKVTIHARTRRDDIVVRRA